MGDENDLRNKMNKCENLRLGSVYVCVVEKNRKDGERKFWIKQVLEKKENLATFSGSNLLLRAAHC